MHHSGLHLIVLHTHTCVTACTFTLDCVTCPESVDRCGTCAEDRYLKDAACVPDCDRFNSPYYQNEETRICDGNYVGRFCNQVVTINVLRCRVNDM